MICYFCDKIVVYLASLLIQHPQQSSDVILNFLYRHYQRRCATLTFLANHCIII